MSVHPRLSVKVRCLPRASFAARMGGAVLSGSCISKDGPYNILHQLPVHISTEEWMSAVLSDNAPYSWLRYSGPPESHCIVAAVEFRGT